MNIEYYKNKYEPIDGKWYITKKLGSGAFGTVLEVERRDQTNMKAAVKIISVPASSGEVESYREENYDLDEQSISSYFFGFVEEFTKEIQLMSELRGHGNIVTIEDYDVKKHTDEIGWDIFIRMELLTPMNKFYRENPPKTRDVIRLGIDICKALEACQKYKITHRDIKPSNIFISKNGDYKLGDFGVSRTLEKTSSGLSKKGTYTYMAPEVFKGEAYGSNVDIYSLGIVMYKILNNNLEPFRKDRTHSDEENALALRLKGEIIPNPANAEGRLAEIVLKACSFNPKERYESPVQMRTELEAILYSENEEKVILGAGETLELELSTNSTNGSNKDVEIKEDTNNSDEQTVSVFGNADLNVPEPDEDKTVGIFDKKNETVSSPSTDEKKEHIAEKKQVIDYDGPIFVDEEHKGRPSAKAIIKEIQVEKKKKDDSTSLFRNIDDYDDELKKMEEPVRRVNLKPSTKKYSVVSSDSGGAFRRMDENDEELQRMRKEEEMKKNKKSIFDIFNI